MGNDLEELRRLVLVASNAAIPCFSHVMCRSWMNASPIRTVPRNQAVKLKTVKGIECVGRVAKTERMMPADRWGPKRVAAKRISWPDGQTQWDEIRAVGWR